MSSLTAVALAANSTVTAPDCVTPSSTMDIVTRSPIPTKDCDAPELTTVPAGGMTSIKTTTKVHTITSCPPTVTDCPIGSETTETMTMTHPGDGGMMPSGKPTDDDGDMMPTGKPTGTNGMPTGTNGMPTGTNGMPTGKPTGDMPPQVTGAASVNGVSGVLGMVAAIAYML